MEGVYEVEEWEGDALLLHCEETVNKCKHQESRRW